MMGSHRANVRHYVTYQYTHTQADRPIGHMIIRRFSSIGKDKLQTRKLITYFFKNGHIPKIPVEAIGGIWRNCLRLLTKRLLSRCGEYSIDLVSRKVIDDVNCGEYRSPLVTWRINDSLNQSIHGLALVIEFLKYS
ncbi:hypothetical protein EG68_02227 [Paragonimus skrjabini miyazakii]|uniref:Uncharacterized protein n=1 Tax=Paragonimus skrjabini miyazakii TaxID=59628 RepID=A0A8S9Z4I4_9TREM|nr:hypothetical protein EG68_02227 [Paragonimus skrjabini miyazakii]